MQTIVVHQHGHGHGKDQQSSKNNNHYSPNVAQQQQSQQQITGERYREMTVEQQNALVDGRVPIPVE